jgi:hypothetical protein
LLSLRGEWALVENISEKLGGVDTYIAVALLEADDESYVIRTCESGLVVLLMLLLL